LPIVDLPDWVNEPYVFLRYALPGSAIVALLVLLWPDVGMGATLFRLLTSGDSGLALGFAFTITIIIGIPAHLLYRVLYDATLLRVRNSPIPMTLKILKEHGSEVIWTFQQAQALFSIARQDVIPEATRNWIRTESNLVHAGYQVSSILVVFGVAAVTTGADMTFLPEQPGLRTVVGVAIIFLGFSGFIGARLRDLFVQEVETRAFITNSGGKKLQKLANRARSAE
jgi:hypothetical protein